MDTDTDSNAAPVPAQATRRVPLMFDPNNDPFFPSVTSPASFGVRALGVMPPRHVIPVIFVPGIMGTNLCSNGKTSKDGTPAWRPPNGSSEGLGEWWTRRSQTPTERQEQMSPDTTRVDESGTVNLPRGLFTLTKEEAQKRHWGEVHSDSYNAFLAWLELNLNDQYENAGRSGGKLLPSWGTATTLHKSVAHTFSTESVDVRKTWNPVKGTVDALTLSELTKAGDYYYPVWAAGYNWLQSNEQSSDALIARIHEALDFYSKSTVMIPEGRVIIITHSMGGLVARRAAQKASGLIMGILHGVQPVTGAPVVYRRLRAGTERGGAVDAKAAILSSIIGWAASDTTPVLGNAPGPLELLPTKHYPPGWLTAGFKGNVKNIDFVRWPATNPYAEIYSKRVQDVWWGMVDEQLLDPAGMAARKRSTPLAEFQKGLRKAETFHDTVKLECHPVTYAYYGADAKYAAFSKVQWLTTDQIAEPWKPLLPAAPLASHNNSGRVVLSMPNGYAVTFNLGDRGESKQNGDHNSGDATVPFFSGAEIKDGALLTCQMVGFDHQNSYNDGNVRDLTVYCVAKIAQHAVAVATLPQSKGK